MQDPESVKEYESHSLKISYQNKSPDGSENYYLGIFN